MKMDDLKSDSSFTPVVVLFAITIVLIIVAATAIVRWRGKNATKAPYTKHPLSMLSAPTPLISVEG